jgi:serine/threonine protein kinase
MDNDKKVDSIDSPPNGGSASIESNTQETDDVQEYPYNYITHELGLEEFRRYNKGGFHPVHLEDVLDNRYEVFHKLGSGGFGIVWLCRDRQLGKWRAVKVMAANHSSDSRETAIFDFLGRTSSPEELEQNNIAAPLESFWIEGPNGRHLCFVLAVYGCPVSRWRGELDDLDPRTPERSKKICGQIVQAMTFLHQKGVCHGDLRPDNILMKLDQAALQELDENQMSDLIEETEAYELRTASGADPRPKGPEYCVIPLTSSWCETLLVEEVVITDFGESFLVDNARRSTGIPTSYAAPEILFQQPIGLEVDTWSLACTIYELRTWEPLFGGSFYGSKFERIVYEFEVLLGQLPEPYRTVWNAENRKGPDDITTVVEDGNATNEMAATCSLSSLNWAKRDIITRGTGYNDIFEAKLGEEREKYFPCIGEDSGKPPIKYRYEKEEVEDLAHLLSGMLQYNPENRMSMEVVSKHQWLHGRRTYSITLLPLPPRRTHNTRAIMMIGLFVLFILVTTWMIFNSARRGERIMTYSPLVQHVLSVDGDEVDFPLECSCSIPDGFWNGVLN